jgi:LuxR family maltose regulon positive regulatory protein
VHRAPESSLFRSKLRIPGVPDYYVRRPRLAALVDDMVASFPLTLVIAPAGVGKTSLLAAWAAEADVPTAWLTLDDTDRDDVELWSGVIAALEHLVPGCADRALEALRRGGQREAVGALLADLEAGPREPMTLVIDDIHLVDEDESESALLGTFLQHLPPWLHVVILGRRRPRLPIDRLRARGQLGEIHMSELRFSDDEAASMLTRLSPAMSDLQREEATRHASGWAAGLQFAALAHRSAQARSGPDIGLHASDELVQHYVWHEVLATERPDLVETLRDTSVVERLNPSLAAALTLRPDAGQLLAEAESRGLFVTRLDPLGGWMGLHALVREMLVADLANSQPERLVRQHSRAAHWFEAAGEDATALEHWLLAGRPADALRLLATGMARLYDTGRQATISAVLARIPTEASHADMESTIAFAWCHLLVDRHRFLETVEQAAGAVARQSDVDETLLGRSVMLQSIADTMTGDWAGGRRKATEAMSHFGDASWVDPIGRFGWNVIAREIALSERWGDTTDEVVEVRASLTHDPERRLAFEGTRALGLALAGQPLDALRVIAGVREAAEKANLTILRGELNIAEAIAHRELGDPRSVADLTALADRFAEPLTHAQVLARLELTEGWLVQGDIEQAAAAFRRAEELVLTEYSGPDGRTLLARTGAAVAVAQGDLDAGRTWVARIGDPFWRGVSAARIHLADGDGARARAALETSAPRCPRHEVICEVLLARAMEGHEDAVKHALTAVEVASSHGMLQSVLAGGSDVVQLLELASWRVPSGWLDRLRRAAAADTSRRAETLASVELLTEREREVLRLLPSRLTLREIAAELYISINTLKFHLKLIYRKLGVTSRAEAAAVVQRMSSVRPLRHRPNTFER